MPPVLSLSPCCCCWSERVSVPVANACLLCCSGRPPCLTWRAKFLNNVHVTMAFVISCHEFLQFCIACLLLLLPPCSYHDNDASRWQIVVIFPFLLMAACLVVVTPRLLLHCIFSSYSSSSFPSPPLFFSHPSYSHHAIVVGRSFANVAYDAVIRLTFTATFAATPCDRYLTMGILYLGLNG